jgi:hypothetical protein
MSNNRSQYKKNGRFIRIPIEILSSDTFINKLNAPEIKLLVDLLMQYYGDNNGNMSPCYTLMKKRGWAKSSLHKAFNNLVHAGFIVVTRQGRKVRGYATLVAITWLPIDEPKPGKRYDDGIVPSKVSLGYWCKIKSSWKYQPERKDYNNSIPPNMRTKS